VRFYRRADGSVLTKDCPVGWQAIKRRVSKTATAFASLVFAALSGIGLSNYFAKSSEPQMIGATIPVIENSITGEAAIGETNPNVEYSEKYNQDFLGGLSSEEFRRSDVIVGQIRPTKRRANKNYKR